MKLIRYCGKGKNFNSIGCVKKLENSDGKNSYFFNLFSVAFKMNVFFTLVIAPQSISSQCFNYVKAAFFISGTLALVWNRWNTFQRKITTTKYGCFFFKNWQEELMWQEIIMISCNKTFKQVMTLALFIHQIALSTDLKFDTSFWISWSSHPELFCRKGVLRNFAKFTEKHQCQRLFFNKFTDTGVCFPVNFAKNSFFHRTPTVAASK